SERHGTTGFGSGSGTDENLRKELFECGENDVQRSLSPSKPHYDRESGGFLRDEQDVEVLRGLRRRDVIRHAETFDNDDILVWKGTTRRESKQRVPASAATRSFLAAAEERATTRESKLSRPATAASLMPPHGSTARTEW
ncbi:unnamed protein product, partial [Amoebophrya sp. A25]